MSIGVSGLRAIATPSAAWSAHKLPVESRALLHVPVRAHPPFDHRAHRGDP
jgi:hypothetical protein